VGTITDGAIRDVAEMTNAGFKALARRMCVGHAWSCPVKWGCDVEVFGQKISPGQLIHADMHGFMAMTPEEQAKILEAARFMDANECTTVIRAARDSQGRSTEELLQQMDAASKAFRAAAKDHFTRGPGGII
jgi:regulator of RNase E activity RraA